MAFVDNPWLPPTNNDAERALRHAVIARYISFGTRTNVSDTRPSPSDLGEFSREWSPVNRKGDWRSVPKPEGCSSREPSQRFC